MSGFGSSLFASENYVGTRRGRSTMGDMGFEMFPEKYESTDMWEDPEQVEDDNRNTLKDFSPDNSRLFAHEEPRRRTYARDRLNLQDGGARTTTDPWANTEYDTSFHDSDPRGWAVEQPWKEYRRAAEAVLRRTDFKDDGDYSTTGGAVHPNSLYKQIRGAQDWVKARLKIFDTSLTGRAAGGVGVYDNVSKVYKSEYEDQSIMMDGSLNQTFEDPANRARATMRLSNMIGGGSKDLRDNTTTDHKVLVASYGKLFSQRGLINHENQMRLIEDDTRYSALEGMGVTSGVPAPVARLMSSAVVGKTAQAAARMANQQSADSPATTEKFHGGRYSEPEVANRGFRLTQEIVTLLGITENELKLLESKTGTNNKAANLAFADLYNMVEAVHAAPAHIKLQMRDELLLKSAGQGLTPSTGRTTQEQVIVNPKIVSFMDSMVRRGETPGTGNTRDSVADPENILKKGIQAPVLVYKSRGQDSDDIGMIARAAVVTSTTDSKKVVSYKNIALAAVSEAKNRDKSTVTQFFSGSSQFTYGAIPIPAKDVLATTMQAKIDNEFGENKSLTRHVGRVGDKRTGRHQDCDRVDEHFEVESSGRKNPKNNATTVFG
jgi:hypothetical protein